MTAWSGSMCVIPPCSGSMEPASSTRHVGDQRSSGVADPAEQGVGLNGIGEALRQGGDGESAAGTCEEGTVVGDAGLPAGLAGEGDPGREVACQAVAVLLLGEDAAHPGAALWHGGAILGDGGEERDEVFGGDDVEVIWPLLPHEVSVELRAGGTEPRTRHVDGVDAQTVDQHVGGGVV